MQLKMLTSEEVQRAMAESASSGNPRLAQVFLQMGLLDRDQLAKLQKVQKDLVEKHRANLMSKLNVHDLARLIRVAIKQGLIFLDE